MKTITYNTLRELWDSSIMHNVEIFETNTSYSFRLFRNRNTTELHICKK